MLNTNTEKRMQIYFVSIGIKLINVKFENYTMKRINSSEIVLGDNSCLLIDL